MTSISVSSFIKLPSILLDICSGKKCDGRTDKASTICSADKSVTDVRLDGQTMGQLHALPLRSIKNLIKSINLGVNEISPLTIQNYSFPLVIPIHVPVQSFKKIH